MKKTIQQTLDEGIITDEEIVIKKLENLPYPVRKKYRSYSLYDDTTKSGKIDKLSEKNPILFAEYCNNNLSIRYQTYPEPDSKPENWQPDNILGCIKQLKKRFGIATKSMLVALSYYDSKLKEEEAVNAYIW